MLITKSTEEKQIFFNNIGESIISTFSIRAGEPSIIAAVHDNPEWLDEYSQNLTRVCHLPLNLDTSKLRSESYYWKQRKIWQGYTQNQVLFISGLEALKPLKGHRLHHNFFGAILSFFKEQMQTYQNLFFFSKDEVLNELISFDDWTQGRFWELKTWKPENGSDYSSSGIQEHLDSKLQAEIDFQNKVRKARFANTQYADSF